MSEPPGPRTRVRRAPERAAYDRGAVHAVLDAGFVCHLGFTTDDGPVVIPTAYGRLGDELYLHGAPAAGFARHLAAGSPVCVTVTHLDGLVLARSTFHHSVNYRSVVVFGSARVVDDPAEKRRALDAFVDHVLPGRAAEARPPTDKELRGTAVLAVGLDEASVKVRTGGPRDDDEDLALPVWAGVVPLVPLPARPEPADDLDPAIPLSSAVEDLLRRSARTPGTSGGSG